MSDENKPVVAAKEPFAVEVEEGKKYFWCTCGKSSTQPFCDGSHQGSSFAPLVWEADSSGTKYFCGCKATDRQPFCDGSHTKL